MKNRFLHKDFVVGILCILVSSFFGWQSMYIKASLNSGDPGGRVFPLIGCGILFVCGIAMLLRKPEGEEAAFLTKPQWKRAAILFGLYILTFLLMWLVGFAVATPIMLIILCYLFTSGDAAKGGKVKTLIKAIIYGILLGAVIYVLYKVALDAKLPVGLIWKKLR